MATGKWRDPGVPHKGWDYVGCEDSGSLSMICEMCEKEEIRHIHTVTHPDFPTELHVGCVCAENLTSDYAKPRAAEAALKRRRARLKTFLTKGWRQGLNGSLSRAWKGRRVLLAPRGIGWIAKVNGAGGRKIFSARDDAGTAVFSYFDRPPAPGR
ncbi:conserved hypothetical protein [Hyphomicrobiales bacterium]|nr:conserved hypothetical protein [Hyphomicrobiales bacterium]CAH1702152.1 conserved hypothetical protein [Hyphomicrobiales bacterium]CAI0346358.1 conserved hypothetical protein [Hyphomicrobiales bacterium]